MKRTSLLALLLVFDLGCGQHSLTAMKNRARRRFVEQHHCALDYHSAGDPRPTVNASAHVEGRYDFSYAHSRFICDGFQGGVTVWDNDAESQW